VPRSPAGKVAVPEDFDPEMYLHLNPDVQISGMDATDHYIRFGKAEGRHYK
jgi:hypothetical protein